jgi:hypothetical protein
LFLTLNNSGSKHFEKLKKTNDRYHSLDEFQGVYISNQQNQERQREMDVLVLLFETLPV